MATGASFGSSTVPWITRPCDTLKHWCPDVGASPLSLTAIVAQLEKAWVTSPSVNAPLPVSFRSPPPILTNAVLLAVIAFTPSVVPAGMSSTAGKPPPLVSLKPGIVVLGPV